MTFLKPETRNNGAMRSAYNIFLTPRSEAVAIPAIAVPPAPMTPTTAN